MSSAWWRCLLTVGCVDPSWMTLTLDYCVGGSYICVGEVIYTHTRILSYHYIFKVQGSWCHNAAIFVDLRVIYIFTSMEKPQFMLLQISRFFEKREHC